MRVLSCECDWTLAPTEAVALQRRLAARVRHSGSAKPWRLVAGVDVGIKAGIATAAVVVLSLPRLDVVEVASAKRPVTYPYVPGLLSFREAPAILEALSQLTCKPDVLLFDGQGYAHPRRMGIATHLGIVLGLPSVGCAKSRLCGTYREPPQERGHYTWLRHHGEVIGAVVRTRSRVKPVYVSVGHLTCLGRAIDLVLRCAVRYRLPEPTRWAHHAASDGWRPGRRVG